MIISCGYCTVHTDGSHEINCPLYPGNNPNLNYQGHPLAGSGYDQGFKAGQKQGRAEVLAACIGKVKKRIQLAQDGGLPGDMRDESLLVLVRKDLEQLQPAASVLEELLREKELNAWDDALAFVWNTLSKTSAEEMKPIYHKRFEIQRELAELEKARASEVGQKPYPPHKPETPHVVLEQIADNQSKPITDKSICQRGHPKACLVEREITNIEKNEGPLNDTEYCSACTQLEAELKPLKEALETLRCFHGESANVFSERYPELAREFYAADNDEPLTRVADEALRRNRG